MAESYKDSWSKNAQNLSDTPMFKKRDVEDALTVLEQNFSIVEKRQEMFDVWQKVRRLYVFDVGTRIPDYISYVPIDASNLPRAVTQMLSALSYKESTRHREPQNPPKVSARQGDIDHQQGTLVTFSSDDDAKLAYYNALSNIRAIFGNSTNVITRDSLERDYNLVWAKPKGADNG
jgi:hypothetical protein